MNNEKKTLTEAQMTAIHYKRRRRYMDNIKRMGGLEVMFDVRKLENLLDVHFSRKLFYDDISL